LAGGPVVPISKFKSFDQLTEADKLVSLIASVRRRRICPMQRSGRNLRSLFVLAIEKKLATFSPRLGLARINETGGWHTWTPAEVDIYRSHHKIGSKARLALELMLNVGARISDASRIGRQADGWLDFVAICHALSPRVGRSFLLRL